MKLLSRRLDELERRAASTAALGDFLTPEEQIAAASGRPSCFFWGGYRGAQRRAPVFLPDWMEDMCAEPVGTIAPLSPFGVAADEKEAMLDGLISAGADGGAVEDIITAAVLSASEFVTLTHRDWMGAVLALGLERRCIGDICVTSSHSAVAFVKTNIAPYIAENLSRAGRDAVTVRLASPGSITVPEREFEKISVTVASPRLDGVVKALCGTSREGAAEMIRRGEVQINHATQEHCDKTVSPADVVIIRGAGKFIIDAYEGESRRGRLRLSVRRFI